MIYCGNVLNEIKHIPYGSIDCVVTSPPYWGLRDYEVEGQFGLEKTSSEYVSNIVLVAREIWRVLRNNGTFWLNLGDCYAKGSKPRGLCGIPWRVAFALQEDGWYLRQDIIWSKPNPMPESVTNRCTKAHEYVFLLTKAAKYYFDANAIREEGVYPAGTKAAKGSVKRSSTKGVNSRPPEYKIYDGFRNRRSVWTVNTRSYISCHTHYASFPEELVEPMILAGCPVGGVVLDPFIGTGTVGVVCVRNDRRYIGIELNPEYVKIAENRICGGDAEVAGSLDRPFNGCLYNNNEGDGCNGVNNTITPSLPTPRNTNQSDDPAGFPPEKVDVSAPDMRLLPQADTVSQSPPVLQQEMLQQGVALGGQACAVPRKNRKVRMGREQEEQTQRSPEIPERANDAGETLGEIQLIAPIIKAEPLNTELVPVRRFCRSSPSL